MNSRKLIGIFATDISSRIQGNLYRELHKEAEKNGYNLILFSGSYDKVNFKDTTEVTYDLFGIARNMNFSAFVIYAQSIGNVDMVKYLMDMGIQKNIPVFVFDFDSLGITRPEGIYSINPDYKHGFAKVVNHLIEHHKCENIYMLAGVKGNKYSDDREDVYKQEMTAHGLSFSEEQIGYGDFWENPAIAAVNKFLDSDLPTPEAICCANDTMAITAIKVLNQRGLRVPEDVLVTGFDGIEDGKYNYPSISTCEPILGAAVEYIFNVLAGQITEEEFLIPMNFFPKDSCGCNRGYSEEDKKEVTVLVENIRVSSWQHHMLATMQFELIDSEDLQDIVGFMNGTLDLFSGYSHLFCIRDDIEAITDYSEKMNKIRIFLNKGLLTKQERDTFLITEVLPDYDNAINRLSSKDMVVIKMIHNADNVYGYHVVRTENYSSIDFRLMGQFTESVTIVIESILRNKRLKHANQKLSEMYERMSEISVRDMLTGLYNRFGYYQFLNEYIRRDDLKDGYVHIISIDMDGMKYINDNFGHHEGDIALKAVAQALNDCFAHPCICSRFGGDEFAVALFTEDGNGPSAEKISYKLNNYLNNCGILSEKEYSVGVSIGQAIAKISEVKKLETIEKIADDSMYEDKRKRKSGR